MKLFTLLCCVLLPVLAQDLKKTVVVMKTNLGDVHIELYPEVAPQTVKNFIELAEGEKEFTDNSGQKVTKPFYDGLIFHRVMKGFMIQGGCPKGTGTGDGGYKFEDEISAKALGLDKEKVIDSGGVPNKKLNVYPRQQLQGMVTGPIYKKLGINSKETYEAKKAEFKKSLDALTMEDLYANLGYKFNNNLKSLPVKKGFLAMANSGPNTNGTQFFINLSDNDYLNGKHTIFGKVVKGMDVVEKIGSTNVEASKPLEAVTITSIRLKK